MLKLFPSEAEVRADPEIDMNIVSECDVILC